MPRIENETEIKRMADIAEIIGRRVVLKPARSGGHLEGSCPFHASKSGRSFHVDAARGSWYCFGCSEGGGLADFVMKFEGCDYREALEIMAAESGVEVRYAASPAGSSDERPQATRQQVLQTLEAACRHYEEELERNAAARAYLEKRGFGVEVVRRWRMGYARGNSVSSVAEASLLETGGVLKVSASGGVYDPLAGRITIPLCDHAGHVLGFTGRLMDAASDRPKYLNTADTMVFKKGRVLFGMREARELLRRQERPLLHIMEGQLKVIAAAEAGLAAVAAGGTAFTPEQAVLATGLSGRVAWCPDPDEAGVKAVLANAPTLRRAGAEVLAGELEVPDSVEVPVKDPDDLRAMGLPVRYQYWSLVEWLFWKVSGGRRTAEAIRDLSRTVVPIITAQPDLAIRWLEMRELARLSGVPESEWGTQGAHEPSAPSAPELPERAAETAVDPSMPPDRLLLATLLRAGRTGWEAAMPWADLPPAVVAGLAQVSHILRLSAERGISTADAVEAVAAPPAVDYYRYWLAMELPSADPAAVAAGIAAEHRRRLAAAAAGVAKYEYAEFLNGGVR
jgi:DNA primase